MDVNQRSVTFRSLPEPGDLSPTRYKPARRRVTYIPELYADDSKMETFLDNLPEDIRERIVNTILSKNCFCDALSLAGITSQRPTVLRALRYKLTLNDVHSQQIPMWIHTFGTEVRVLDLQNLRCNELPINISPLPKLRRAIVHGEWNQLALIKGSPNLSSVKIALHSHTDWGLLSATLRSLKLKEVQLHCVWNHRCFFRGKSDLELRHLGHCCGAVQRFEMECMCDMTRDYWALIHSLRGVETLALHSPVEREHVAFLRGLREVELRANMPVRRAVTIGHGLTVVTQRRRACEETASLLKGCPRLRDVRLGLLDGAERGLVDALANVKVLDLSWGYDDYYDDESDDEFGDGFGDGWGVGQREADYYQPDAGVLLALVEKVGGLSEVYFRRAMVKVGVLERVIHMCGAQLRKIGVHMNLQEEDMAERLVRLLQALGKWCPNVDGMEVLCPLMLRYATAEQKDRCVKALRKVKTGSKWFRVLPVQQFIDGFEEAPVGSLLPGRLVHVL